MSMLSPLAILLLAAAPQDVELLSRAAGPVSSLPSTFLDASADSRFVLLNSRSSNVVAGQVDTEDSPDLFLVDRQTNTAQLVTHLGDQVTCGLDFTVDQGVMNDDGSVVVFISGQQDLVPGFDTQGNNQVYLYRRSSGAIVPLTRSASDPSVGANGNTFSVDVDGAGRVAVISSNANNLVPGFVDASTGADAYGINLATGAAFLVGVDAANPNRGAEAANSGFVFFTNLRISNDGTQVYFSTSAVNLIAGFQSPSGGTTRGSIFRRDLAAGTTTLVTSAAGSMTQAADQGGRIEDISADGERIVFTSESSDLVAGQVSPPFDRQVFVYDASTGLSRIVSHLPGQPLVPSAGLGGPAKISADGRRVAYAHQGADLLAGGVDTNGRSDLFVYDLGLGQTVHLVTHEAGQPTVAETAAGLFDQDFQIDATGSTVAFSHTSDTLITGFSHPLTEQMNSYRRDLSTGSLELLSRDAGSPLVGANESDNVAGLSPDGTIVFRRGFAGNLESGTIGGAPLVYASGSLGQAPDPLLRRAGTPSVSADGYTSLISGTASLRSASDDGRWVLLMSTASNLTPGAQRRSEGESLYLKDTITGATRLVNHVGNGLTTTYSAASAAGISGDGGTVAFSAIGTEGLVPGFMDDGLTLGLYALNAATGVTEVLSSSSANPAVPSGGTAFLRGISDDGRFVLYGTSASDVVPGAVDTNNDSDVILVDRLMGTRVLVSHAAGSAAQAGNARSSQSWLSGDGGLVVFASRATDLVAGFVDSNGPFGDDVFAYDVASGTTRLVSRTAINDLVGANSASFGPQVAADGTIVFQSLASDLIQGYVDLDPIGDDLFRVAPNGTMSLAVSDSTQPLTGMDDGVDEFSLSRDGASLVVLTNAQNIVSGFIDRNGSSREDLFHVDLESGAVQVVGNRLGQPTTGGDRSISRFELSGNGRRVAWVSDSNDVVAGQAGLDFFANAFVLDVDTSTTRLVSVRPANTGVLTGSTVPFFLSISGNGAFVDFVSSERDFVAGDFNGATDVFRVDLGAQCIGTSVCGGAINSSGGSASLCLVGSEVAAVNSMTVVIEGLPQQVFGLLLTSSELGFLPNPGGSLGDLCINGQSLGRYNGAVFNSGGVGSASIQVNLAQIPAGGQFVAATAGSTHSWQCWYRDVVSGTAVSNFSEARNVVFR